MCTCTHTRILPSLSWSERGTEGRHTHHWLRNSWQHQSLSCWPLRQPRESVQEQKWEWWPRWRKVHNERGPSKMSSWTNKNIGYLSWAIYCYELCPLRMKPYNSYWGELFVNGWNTVHLILTYSTDRWMALHLKRSAISEFSELYNSPIMKALKCKPSVQYTRVVGMRILWRS